MTCKTVNGLVACWLVTEHQIESGDGVQFSIDVDGTTQTMAPTRDTNPTLRTASNCGNSDGHCYVFSFTTEQASSSGVVSDTTPAPQDQQGDPPPPDLDDGDAAEKKNWPETTNTVSDGVVTTQIVNRPAGENVVAITPMSDGILITGLDSGVSHSEAPLWPDNPNKGDSDADPGLEIVSDAIGPGQNVIVLTRPTTGQSDADHADQWDAWQTTYLELVERGDHFIECEPAHAGLPVEECWVTDPARVPTQDDQPGDQDDTQPIDPAPVVVTQTDQPDSEDTGQPTDPAPEGVVQLGWVENPEWTDPGQVEDSSADETDGPLLTTSQNPDDGSEIVVVNVPKLTDDVEQNEKNGELQSETEDALYDAGAPYMVCFPEETLTDIHTGQPVTTPAFCNTVYP